MKPLYLILIGAVILVVIFLVVRSNKKKQEAASTAAAAAIASQSTTGSLPPGGSSGVAQIISALLPYFNTATNAGLIGSGTGKPQVTPEYLPPKQVSLI